ncbi:MAG TPA: hypothetical protein VGZ49_06190 [Xanthobacteraceae bacterium]|nr:hypothetical protein [Xanthobacteraceae bacterium]
MPELEFLIGKANDLCADQFEDARLCRAIGSTGGKPAMVAGDIHDWAFIFLVRNGHASIHYNGARFEPPQHHQGLPEGEQPMEGPLDKTLADALAIIRHAEFSQPFTRIDLLKPLYPGVVEPFYMFALGVPPQTKIVGVGANTGNIQS